MATPRELDDYCYYETIVVTMTLILFLLFRKCRETTRLYQARENQVLLVTYLYTKKEYVCVLQMSAWCSLAYITSLSL